LQRVEATLLHKLFVVKLEHESPAGLSGDLCSLLSLSHSASIDNQVVNSDFSE